VLLVPGRPPVKDTPRRNFGGGGTRWTIPAGAEAGSQSLEHRVAAVRQAPRPWTSRKGCSTRSSLQRGLLHAVPVRIGDRYELFQDGAPNIRSTASDQGRHPLHEMVTQEESWRSRAHDVQVRHRRRAIRRIQGGICFSPKKYTREQVSTSHAATRRARCARTFIGPGINVPRRTWGRRAGDGLIADTYEALTSGAGRLARLRDRQAGDAAGHPRRRSPWSRQYASARRSRSRPT